MKMNKSMIEIFLVNDFNLCIFFVLLGFFNGVGFNFTVRFHCNINHMRRIDCDTQPVLNESDRIFLQILKFCQRFFLSLCSNK